MDHERFDSDLTEFGQAVMRIGIQIDEETRRGVLSMAELEALQTKLFHDAFKASYGDHYVNELPLSELMQALASAKQRLASSPLPAGAALPAPFNQVSTRLTTDLTRLARSTKVLVIKQVPPWARRHHPTLQRFLGSFRPLQKS